MHRKDNRFAWQENKANYTLGPEAHNILIRTSLIAFDNTLCGSSETCPKSIIKKHDFKRKCRLYGTILQKFSSEADEKYSEVRRLTIVITTIVTHYHVTKLKGSCYGDPICNFLQLARKSVSIV